MNYNTPHAAEPGSVDPTPEQRRALQESVQGVAAATRRHLPDDFVVGSQVGEGDGGVQATVAVRPPAGHAVSAGFSAEFDGDDDPISETDREEVARGLAAGAALQVKQAIGEEFTPAAR